MSGSHQKAQRYLLVAAQGGGVCLFFCFLNKKITTKNKKNKGFGWCSTHKSAGDVCHTRAAGCGAPRTGKSLWCIPSAPACALAERTGACGWHRQVPVAARQLAAPRPHLMGGGDPASGSVLPHRSADCAFRTRAAGCREPRMSWSLRLVATGACGYPLLRGPPQRAPLRTRRAGRFQWLAPPSSCGCPTPCRPLHVPDVGGTTLSG